MLQDNADNFGFLELANDKQLQLDQIQKSMPTLQKIVLSFIGMSKYKALPMLGELAADLELLIRENVLKQPTHLTLPMEMARSREQQQFETIVVNQIHSYIPYPE